MPFDAILFDLDGLLIDSEPFWHEAEQIHFASVGVPMSMDDCLALTGLRVDAAVAQVYARRPWDGPPPEEIARRIFAHVVESTRTRGELMPGARDALDFARSTGRPVALVTSSAPALIEAVVARFDLADSFDLLHSSEAEPHPKPHPAVYLGAADRLGVRPEACLALEDSLYGLIAAKAARMTCVVVPQGPARQDPRFALADVRLESLAGFGVDLWRRLEG